MENERLIEYKLGKGHIGCSSTLEGNGVQSEMFKHIEYALEP